MTLYYELWAKSFGLPIDEFRSAAAARTSAGSYLEKYGTQFVFQFKDLSSGKEIVAAAHEQPISFDSMTIAFDDYDFGFTLATDYQQAAAPPGFTFRALENGDSELSAFVSACNEDDLDTLNLTFENEIAFGMFEGPSCIGVARAAAMSSVAGLVDVTVLILPARRGQRLSAPLVSHLLTRVLKNGLLPKYRVAHDNLASQAVAVRLGFEKMFHVRTWSA